MCVCVCVCMSMSMCVSKSVSVCGGGGREAVGNLDSLALPVAFARRQSMLVKSIVASGPDLHVCRRGRGGNE